MASSSSPMTLARALALLALPLGLAASGQPLVPARELPQAETLLAAQRRPDPGPAWQAFLDRNPGLEVMDWDRHHDAPHRVIGGSIDLPGAPFGDAAALDAALRTFMADHKHLLAIDPGALLTEGIVSAGDVWYAHYAPVLEGRRLLESELTFRVSRAGRLMLFGSDARLGLTVRPGLLDRAELETRVRAASDGPVEVIQPLDEEFLLPLPGEGGRYTLAEPVRVFEVERLADHRKDRVFISAHTGQVLKAYSLIRHLTVEGQLFCQVEPQAPGDTQEPWPMAWTGITVDGVPTVTNGQGEYTVEVPGSAPWTVAGQFRGLYADVNRQDGSDTGWSLAQGANGASLVVGQGLIMERDAYTHTHHVHDFIKGMDPVFDGLDEPLPVNININQTCNAYWDGGSINFFLAGMDCPNTSQVAGVVYHEYGHGINDRQYQQAGAPWGMENGAMHEGLADVTAIYLQDESYVSPGWNIRNLDNSRRYPEHIVNQVHTDGLIIGGAMYDLRERLPLETVRPLYHQARWGRPDDSNSGRAFFEYFLELLVADDDNGDLSDLCPHFSQIDEAFNLHGIGSDLAWTVSTFEREPLGLYTAPGQELVLRFELVTPEWVPVSGVSLFWREQGSATTVEVPAQPDGPEHWLATLPGLDEDSWIEYWAVAQNGAGVELVCPTGAPETPFRLYYGNPGVQLLDFESGPAGGTGDWPWEWGIPFSGPDGAFSGDNLWATGLSGEYDDLRLAWLEFPARQILGNAPPGIRFMHWHALESGWDGGTVQVSVNNGPWQTVQPAGGYDFVTPDNSILPGVPAFTGNRDWTEVTIDLSTVTQPGDEVALRFGLLTDTSVTGEGWYIDDLEFTAFEGSSQIVHDPLPDTEDVQTAQFPVTATIERQPAPDTVILRWHFEDAPETETVMTASGSQWSAVIPGPQAEGTVWYRIEASGAGGYSDSSPPFQNLWHHFLLGEDREPPTVGWVRPPIDSIYPQAFWRVSAQVEDNLGVASVQVFQRRENGDWEGAEFLEPGEDGLWHAELDRPYTVDFEGNRYFKLLATDAGALGNTAESAEVVVELAAEIEDGFEDPELPLWIGDGSWRTTTQLHHTGEACLSFGVPGQLPLSADSPLELVQCLDWREFHLGQEPRFEGQLLYNLEAGDDFLVLEVAADDGPWIEWQRWTGQSGGWQWVDLGMGESGDLYTLQGQACVRLRLRVELDGDNNPLPSSIVVLDEVSIYSAHVSVEPRAPRPADFGITAAWPNPFNPSTRVAFRLDHEGPIDLALFNLQGQRLRSVAQGVLPAGEHQALVDGSGLASGLYLLSLESGGRRSVHKVMLLK
jgi:hypothetical protein